MSIVYIFASLTMTSIARANPDISVSFYGYELTSGKTYSPSSVFFGSSLPRYELQTTKIETYTITNKGTASLQLEDAAPTVTAVRTGIDVFSAIYGGVLTAGNYSQTSIAPGATATFTVTTNAYDINFEYRVVIKSNDPDEASFSFNYEGKALPPDRPEITVNFGGDAKLILNNGVFKLYDIPEGITLSEDFLIGNWGKQPLVLAGAKPTISGENNVDVDVSNYSGISIAEDEEVKFTLTFTPLAEDDFSFNVTIESNDQDENPYTFLVKGTAIPSSLSIPSVEIVSSFKTHDGVSAFIGEIYFTDAVDGFTKDDIILSGAEFIPDGAIIDGNPSPLSGFTKITSHIYYFVIKPTGSADITIEVPRGVANTVENIRNSGAKLVIPYRSPSGPSSTIAADFLINRANHILISQSDMIDFITGDINKSGGPLGDLQLNSDLNNQTTMSFSTSHSRLLGAIKDNHLASTSTIVDNDLSLAYNKDGKEDSPSGTTGSADRVGTFDVWTQIKGSQSDRNKNKYKFWTAHLGGHYFLKPDMLIGLMGQFDWSEQRDRDAITSLASKTFGNGFMVGPYITGKIKDQPLYYEARGLWGQSDNKISPTGTYEDKFKTNRWLIRGKFKGSYDLSSLGGDLDLYGVMLEPSISLSYFEETHESYISNNSITIPEQKISLGEFRFGPSLTRSFDLGEKIGEGYHMKIKMGMSGIANFAVKNASASQGAVFDAKSRARIDGSIEIRNIHNVSVTVAGFYDGFGTNNYSAYGGRLGIAMPIY